MTFSLKQLLKPALILALVNATGVFAGELMVHDAWIRAMPPNARAVPVYLSLHNGSEKDIALTAIETPLGRIELHQSIQQGEMMKMQRVERIEVAAHAMVKLAPMGYHGMLLDMQAPPAGGEQVALTLHFDNGETARIEAPVIAGQGEMMASGHEHHH